MQRPRENAPKTPVSARAIQVVRIRFRAKPISRHSHCPMFWIVRGRTASITLVRPRRRRTTTIIEAAAAESIPTFK